jgi:WD40 repeat protein
LDGTTRIWDSATGECRHTLREHTGPVEALALAPDGSWLATAGTDRTVRIWDPATGAVRAALRLGAAPRHAAAVSADLLVVAGERGPHFLRLTG